MAKVMTKKAEIAAQAAELGKQIASVLAAQKALSGVEPDDLEEEDGLEEEVEPVRRNWVKGRVDRGLIVASFLGYGVLEALASSPKLRLPNGSPGVWSAICIAFSSPVSVGLAGLIIILFFPAKAKRLPEWLIGYLLSAVLGWLL